MDIPREIQKLYVAYLNRPADPLGLQYYSRKLKENGYDLVSIAREIGRSEEFKKIYEGLKDEEIVDRLYRTLLSREPERDGFTFWTEQLKTKRIPLDLLPLAMAQASSGIDSLTLKNKIDSAMNFTLAIDPDLDGKDLLATYGGENDALLGRFFLSKVSYEPKTLMSLRDCRLFLISRICDPEDPLLRMAKGEMEGFLKKAVHKSRTVETINWPVSLTEKEVLSLLSGARWKEKMLTYSFSFRLKPIIPLEVEDFPESMDLEVIIPPPQRHSIREAIRKISEIADLSFKEVLRGADIRILFAELFDGFDGFTFYRREGEFIIPPAIIILDLGYPIWRPIPILPQIDLEPIGNFCQSPKIIYHCLLHALGLKHPNDGEKIWEDADIPRTVLAENEGRIYTPYLARKGDGSYEVGLMRDALPQTIGLYDAQALLFLYGPNRKTGSGDDVYSFETWEKGYRIIWDSGGKDLIDASRVTLDSVINLEGGSYSSIGLKPPEVWAKLLLEGIKVGEDEGESLKSKILDRLKEYDRLGLLYNGSNNLGIVKGVVIECVKTGPGNDTVYDNQVDNVIELGAGSDKVFLGKGGFDIVDGGCGYDTVFLPYPKDSFEICVLPEFSIIIHDSFAVKLISVEELVFTDGLIIL